MTVVWRGDEFVQRVMLPAIDRGLAQASFVLSDEMAGQMPGPGASFDGKRYTPSFPGTPPGQRLTRLKGSMTFAKLKEGTWAAGTDVEYAKVHELGLTIPRPRGGGRTRMPRRPFMLPALREGRQRINRAFIRKVSQQIARRALR